MIGTRISLAVRGLGVRGRGGWAGGGGLGLRGGGGKWGGGEGGWGNINIQRPTSKSGNIEVRPRRPRRHEGREGKLEASGHVPALLGRPCFAGAGCEVLLKC